MLSAGGQLRRNRFAAKRGSAKLVALSMEESSPTRSAAAQVVRFGVYEADPRSGELRKNGVKLRLQEQPFQILMVLLERAGEVVTRDELRQRLWSNDTFVDFDHGLNTAINKLRDVLGDTASNPRFVETLARRGYRFIAPVQWIDTTGQRANGPAGDRVIESSGQRVNGPTEATNRETVARPEVEQRPSAIGKPQTAPAPESLDQLPKAHRGLTRLLFTLIQVMYLVFYCMALWKLDEVRYVAGLWLIDRGWMIAVLALVSGTVGIAVRLYLTTAVLFDYPGLGRSFRRMFPVVLPLDQLWALAPFLLLPKIGLGAAFAACAALLYLPFSERTLIRMSYVYE